MTILLGAPGGSVVNPTVDGGGGPDRSGVRIIWQGGDGSVWDLTSADSPVRLMQSIKGLSMPPRDRFADQSPAVAGSRFRGYRTVERPVYMALAVYSDTGTPQDFYDLDGSFFGSLDPAKLGRLSVVRPNGLARHLSLRFEDDGDADFDRDPGPDGWATYGLTFVAEDPYWYGDPVVSVFQESPPQQFFGGNASPAGGPPFFISSSNTLASASLNNDGDVEAFPIFTVEGPTTSVTVGVGGKNTVIPFQVSAGNSVVLDMSPAEQTAIDSAGKDRTSELTNPAFVAVPPGQKVPLTIQMVGTGSVTVEVVPRYWRAW